MSGPFPSGHKVLSTDLNPMLLGWIDFVAWFGSTLAYVSADAPTFVFSIDADVTAVIEPGMRVKLTQTTDKFFIVTAVSTFSAGHTQITVYGGTDYTLANAAISAGSFSTHKKPYGFNVSPAKWTQTLRDTSTRSQATPVSGTWYNLGSLSLDIPIGIWDVAIAGITQASRASSITDCFVSLSTANNGASDGDFTSFALESATGATAVQVDAMFGRRKTVALAAKTTYYVVSSTSNGADSISALGASAPTIVRAICAYL